MRACDPTQALRDEFRRRLDMHSRNRGELVVDRTQLLTLGAIGRVPLKQIEQGVVAGERFGELLTESHDFTLIPRALRRLSYARCARSLIAPRVLPVTAAASAVESP